MNSATEQAVITLLGGTGHVGAAYIREFLARGVPIRILARTPVRVARRFPQAWVVAGTMMDEEHVVRALAEVAELAGQISGRKVIASGNWPWLSLLRLALPLFRRFKPVMASKVHMLTYFDEHDYVGKGERLAAVLPGFEVTTMETYLEALLTGRK